MKPRDLALATGARIDRATAWLPFIEQAMAEFNIDTPARQAMFLSQIGHESGGLRWTLELWGPTMQQSRYEGRLDLGNTKTGDGLRFRGRGLLQITGRFNYAATGKALGVDVLMHPELLAQPALGARSAGWWWKTHGLNELADTGDVRKCRKVVNGGINGLAECQALFAVAQQVLA